MIDGQDRQDILEMLDNDNFYVEFMDNSFRMYPEKWRESWHPDHPNYDEYMDGWNETGKTFNYPKDALLEVMIAYLGGDWDRA